jgi:hypothetical protein
MARLSPTTIHAEGDSCSQAGRWRGRPSQRALNPLTLTLRSRPRVMPKPEYPETVPQQCQEQRHGGQCPGHETRIVSGQFGGGIKGHPLQISSTRRWVAPLRSGGVRSGPHGRLLRGRGGGGAAGV